MKPPWRMGRSRGGLTSKVHAVVDANDLPIRIGLTPGEAHDNRLCLVLLAGLRPRNDGAGGSWLRCRLDQRVRHPAGCLGQHTTEGEPQGPDLLQSPSLTGRVTWWIGSSVRLSNAGVSPPAMTSSPPTTSPSSNLLRSGFGCAVMSPRLRRVPHRPCRGDERHRSVGSSSPSRS